MVVVVVVVVAAVVAWWRWWWVVVSFAFDRMVMVVMIDGGEIEDIV